MKKILSIVFSIIFMIWFIASIVLMIWLSKTDRQLLMIAVFGQYFLVFGIIAIAAGISSHNFTPITLIFPAVGIAAIIISVILQYGSDEAKKIFMGILPYLFLGLFGIVGVCLIIIPHLTAESRRERCTYMIGATVEDLRVMHGKHGGRLYSPVFTYVFKEEMIESCNNVYLSGACYDVGEHVCIYIDPEKPADFYDEKLSKKGLLVTNIVGGAFTAAGLIGLFMVFTAL